MLNLLKLKTYEFNMPCQIKEIKHKHYNKFVTIMIKMYIFTISYTIL